MNHVSHARTGLAFALSAALLAAAPPGDVSAAAPRHPIGQAAEWADVSALLENIDDAYTAPPALDTVVTKGYTSGLLLGNGDLAVTSDARDHAQTLYLAKSDFWEAAKGQLHLGRLTIDSPVDSPEDRPGTPAAKDAEDPNYRQRQDIRTAEAQGTQTMGGQVVHTRTWTADGEDLLVTELRTDDDAERLPLRIDVTMPDGSSGVARDGQIWVKRATGTDTDTGWVSKAATSTKVVGSPTPVTATAPAGDTARLSFDLLPGRSVRLVTSVHGNGSYANPTALSVFADRSVERVAGLGTRDVATARDRHRDWWKRFWLKSYIDTGDATLNKFYYGALYALGAASREGHFPPGTYAPWRTGDFSNLKNNYYLNYNTESQYYGVYSANRPELARLYYKLIASEIPYMRNLTHAAGYEGVTFKRSIMPFDMTRPAPAGVPVKDHTKLPSDQQTNATFAALPFLWQYEYTGDKKFFRETTYPFLKGLGDFWLDFVEKDPATGKYVVRHSGVNEGGDDVSSVYDLGYIRRVLTALISGSKDLGVDAGRRPVWQEVLDKLTPYPTATKDGLDVILLADEINNPIKGNALLNKNDQPINLEGVVHPSDNLAIGGDPGLLQLVRNALQWVDPFLPGSRGSSVNGFPKTFTIAARAGWDPDDLIRKFTTVIEGLWRPNLTVRQPGGGQETSGAMETVDSMMLQTYQGVTRVFPAWPEDRDARFVRLRAKGAFTVSAERKHGDVRHVDVTSEKGNRFALASPWGGDPVTVVDDHDRRVAHTTRDGVVSFRTAPGRTYHLTH